MKYWELIADNLSKADWSWGCVSAIDSNGRTMWIADARRDNGKRFVMRGGDILTAFLELPIHRLSEAGWSWGCVATVDANGRTIFVADAHRGDGQRFVVHADEKLTAFIELESAICESGFIRSSSLILVSGKRSKGGSAGRFEYKST